MKKYLLPVAIFTLVSVSLQSCKTDDGPSGLDARLVYNNPLEFFDIVDHSYASFWAATHQTYPNMPINVMAQGLVSNLGNWGMRDVSALPRVALRNDADYIYSDLFSIPWEGLYETLTPLNGILEVMNEDRDEVLAIIGADEFNAIAANAKALQGLSLGYLSLIYNKAFIVDENSDLDNLIYSSFEDVNDAAIEKLVSAVDLFEEGGDMTGWNGQTFSNLEVINILKAFIAKFEVSQARNSEEVSSLDWNRVLANTEGSITDLAPLGTGAEEEWWNRMLIQGQDKIFTRVHQKIIKMMNPSKPEAEVPYPIPDGTPFLPEIEEPDDNRILTDFDYSETPEIASRLPTIGAYSYNRYSVYRESLAGPMIFLSDAEVRLLRAEALLRTNGDKVEVVGLINETRVNRGGLTPLSGQESDELILEAIAYERIVEFSHHGTCNVWFYRRMITPSGNQDASSLYYLEPRTARHLPVPASILEFRGESLYTFGGDESEQ
ncbi:hypothetical protein [Roseivirga sp.]|uniref:hypothetical protein n=1 Tax=Roseivirga sp. TaxID=1964215 RepID=UPI003B8DEC4D